MITFSRLNRLLALSFLMGGVLPHSPASASDDLVLHLLVPLPSGHDVVIWVDRSDLSEGAWLPVFLGKTRENTVEVDKVVIAHRARNAGRAELTVFDRPFSGTSTETMAANDPALFEISGDSVFQSSPPSSHKVRLQGRWERTRFQLGSDIPAKIACPFVLR